MQDAIRLWQDEGLAEARLILMAEGIYVDYDDVGRADDSYRPAIERFRDVFGSRVMNLAQLLRIIADRPHQIEYLARSLNHLRTGARVDLYLDEEFAGNIKNPTTESPVIKINVKQRNGYPFKHF